MKLVLAWLAALAITAITWASCSVPHKSGDFECTTQADCAHLPGRVCSGGYCVVTNGGLIDAPRADASRTDAPLPIDAPANVCPPQCTSCNGTEKTCKIDCGQTNCTSAEIVCPAGWTCSIDCSTPNSCRNGIDCEAADGCVIACSGSGSCRDIACGAGACQVSCTGQSSCRRVDCADACACDVGCTNGAGCSEITCAPDGQFTCRTFGGGCTSMRPGCNTCP